MRENGAMKGETMKTPILTSALVVLALTGPVLAHNDHRNHPPMQGEQGMPARMMDKLGLTADQKPRFEAMHKTHMPAMQRLKEQLKAQQDKLDGLMKGERTTPAEFKAALDQLRDLQARRAQLQADHRLEMFQLLTPAQRVLFADLHRQHGDHDD